VLAQNGLVPTDSVLAYGHHGAIGRLDGRAILARDGQVAGRTQGENIMHPLQAVRVHEKLDRCFRETINAPYIM